MARLTARRSAGLLLNSGREELKTSVATLRPGVTQNRELLMPYFLINPRSDPNAASAMV